MHRTLCKTEESKPHFKTQFLHDISVLLAPYIHNQQQVLKQTRLGHQLYSEVKLLFELKVSEPSIVFCLAQ